jgi:hypothetical protein
LRKVQGIESKGATRIALEYIDTTWTLAVANSYNDKEINCAAQSKIYHWLPGKNEFVLIRDVGTVGANDVAIILVDKNGVFHESYVAFSENGEEGEYGKVVILRYNSKADNYFLHQSIETTGPVSAIYAFSLPQFTYLVIVSPADGLLFYHYCHAEVI